MCGIAGLIHRGKSSNVGSELQSMLQALKHRGPDSTGYALYADNDGKNFIMRFKVGENVGEGSSSVNEDASVYDKRKKLVDQMLVELGAKIIKDENPEYLAYAFDSKGKTFRHEMYEEYKANRPPMPDELQQQLPHLWEILDAMNVPVLKKDGVEADDIIGTLAVRAQNEGLDTYIVSGDKDFMQLINENIFLYAPGTKKSPNFEETVKVAETSNCPVIISGGVSSIDDIKKAKSLKNIEGVIVGKAIYDGDIKLEELEKEIDA